MADVVPEKNPEVPTITSAVKTERVQDPKRVEVGKRLAQISKAAKERKARERLAAETGLGVGVGWSTYYGYLIGTIGLVIGGVSLYYSMRQERRAVRRLETVEEERVMEGTVVKSEPQNPVRIPPVLDSFDE